MRVIEGNLPVLRATEREALVRCLKAMGTAAKVRRIILFGSSARGTAGSDSDVDLCVVAEGVTSQYRAACNLRRAIGTIRGKPSLSLVPVSPERLAEKERQKDPFFMTVLREGVPIAEED
jgi:predicted nucleotidyltransferase